MQEKQMYIADDGTPFESASECKTYENQQNLEAQIAEFIRQINVKQKAFAAQIVHRFMEFQETGQTTRIEQAKAKKGRGPDSNHEENAPEAAPEPPPKARAAAAAK